jgi:SulP family sulfate permease
MLKKFQEFIPKSYLCLRKYRFDTLKKDLIAGLTVGIISLPLAMAFAMASGIAPEKGLYTAIVGGFLVSLLGGSRVQIAGPTGAFVVIVYSIVQRHGYEGLILATFMAALMLIALGLFRMGSLIKLIPYPLVIGFTAGIAVSILSSQARDFFGLQISNMPADFVEKLGAYFDARGSLDPLTTIFSAGTLFFILYVRRNYPRIPWGVAGILFATVMAALFALPVETVQSYFGDIPNSLPSPSFNLDFSKIRDVFPDSITIALLAAIESLLSAVIADGMMGTRHKSNCELVGQGVANLGSVLFGGMPVTAAIARTATNIKTGAQTPVAGMIHALTLYVIITCFSTLVGYIPLAALAAVLIVVSWQMAEVRKFRLLLKAPKSDVAVLLSSFLLTVFVDITVAVEVGMILATLLLIKRMSDLKTAISKSTDAAEVGTQVFELHGPLFFGVADRLKDVFQGLDTPPKKFILKMKHVPVLDASGADALRELNSRCMKEDTQLVLSDVQAEPAELLATFGLSHLILKP